ncbi:hypothetical protein V2J09_006050 [Rumex salicifolius]
MKISYSLFPFVFIYLFAHHCQAQPSTQGYPCNRNRTTSSYPCQTYAFYRATPPNLLNIAAIGNLFSVSQLMISEPSNISSPSSSLVPDQSLLIPISCGCNFVQNLSLFISYSNLTYRIQSDDTFWLVSTSYYGNLTTYQSVEAVNPTLVPTDLSTGQDVNFPVFCKCPNQTQMGKGVKWLISYVVQPGDDLSSIATRFGTTKEKIAGVNGNTIQPSSTVFVPVSRLPQLSQPSEVAPEPTQRREDDYKGDVVGFGVGLGVCVVLLGLIIGILVCRERYFRRRFHELKLDRKEKAVSVGIAVEGKESCKELDANFLADVSDSLDKYKVFEIGDLRDATNGFDDKFLIQGSVFKACFQGKVYAIKKMGWNAYEELKILQMVNHGSLVKLEGFCIDPEGIDPEDGICYLVYDYIENGSLYFWLHNNKEKLTWKTRVRIATDIANGLQYMHEHTRPQVVHKDIKSSNILLDSNMRAKIANFGLAKSGCNPITTHIVGTQGYMAPEYLSGGVVSTKTDVFSFGVVLLELVTGKEAVTDDGKVILWASVQGLLDGDNAGEKEKIVSKWMDQTMLSKDNDDSFSMESVMSVVSIAVACVSKDPRKRPRMMDIVYALSKGEDQFFGLSGDGFVPPVVAR